MIRPAVVKCTLPNSWKTRTRASWQPYRNETQDVLAPRSLRANLTIAFHLAALAAGCAILDVHLAPAARAVDLVPSAVGGYPPAMTRTERIPMGAWLRAGAGPLAALALVSAAAGQDVTRIDPVVEFRQKMPAEIDADEPFPVEILVRNTGKATAEAVTVTDVIGPNVSFVDADPSPARGDGRLSWALGSI